MTLLDLVPDAVLRTAVLDVAPLLVRAADPAPEPEDVKAGWTAFAIWLGMAAAVALLCWSLVRQLRKAQRAKDAGVYGDEPTSTDVPANAPSNAPEEPAEGRS